MMKLEERKLQIRTKIHLSCHSSMFASLQLTMRSVCHNVGAFVLVFINEQDISKRFG